MRVSLLVSLALAAPGVAQAGGSSIDIELLRPALSPGAVPGVDSPLVTPLSGSTHRLRLGLVGQYTQDPLFLYDLGVPVGAVVRDRASGWLGADFAINQRAAVRLVLPMVWQGSTQVATFGADGFGAGDVSAAFRFRFVDVGPFTGGFRADFAFPTGRKDAYVGEDGLRTGGALLGRLEVWRLAWLADVGAVARSPVDTDADFALGSELAASSAVQGAVWANRFWLYSGVMARSGFNEFFQGGAENGIELIAGGQYAVTPALQVDLGWGTGLTEGYGTTVQRYMAMVTWVPEPRPPEPPPIVAVEEPPPVIIEEPPEQEWEKEEWKEGELARVTGKQIVIRDPIQFDYNTNTILPISVPTLRAVADLMRGDDRIESVVVEGHASEEGSDLYNYDLSLRRAQAVWEQLVLAGVHPERLSTRGMGEVVPKVEGTDESALAINRRVEFHIVRQLDPLEPTPDRSDEIELPWSGEAARVSPPPPGQVVNAAREAVTEEIETELVLPPADKKPATGREKLDINFDDVDDEDDGEKKEGTLPRAGDDDATDDAEEAP